MNEADDPSRLSSQAPDAERAVAGSATLRVALERLRLGLFAVLHDAAGLEQHALRDLAPCRRAPQQELEVHAEVLVLLADGVLHHRDRLGILLDRDPLLVPADGLGFLGQRRAQTREGPRGCRELVGGLVILVKTHPLSLVTVALPL